ncbi:hypothetical protein Taro_037834, partial [Colocasia esculenta]|nr:hypothetical protein [Colocasia esculenta]
KNNQAAPGRKGFCLVFVAALVGITFNQNFYFLGLRLGSSSMATAMINMIPAITFLMAAPLGLEKVNIRSLRSVAKIVGTAVCVGGAITMALLKGPKINLLHMGLKQTPSSLLHTVGEDWVMGCLFLFGSCCCWSSWLIIQVPINKCFSSSLSLSAWMCFLAFLQSSMLAFFMEPDRRAWRLDSSLQITYCIYAVSAPSCVCTH